MELKHHGILGQKWGVRHGPPYPLDESQYSGKEKKLAEISNRLVKKETNTFYKNIRNGSYDEKLDPYEIEALRDAYDEGLVDDYTVASAFANMKYSDLINYGNRMIENGKDISEKELSKIAEASGEDLKKLVENFEKLIYTTKLEDNTFENINNPDKAKEDAYKYFKEKEAEERRRKAAIGVFAALGSLVIAKKLIGK